MCSFIFSHSSCCVHVLFKKKTQNIHFDEKVVAVTVTILVNCFLTRKKNTKEGRFRPLK